MPKHVTEKEVNYAHLYSPACRRCNMVKANDMDYCKRCLSLTRLTPLGVLSEKGGFKRTKKR